MVEKKSSQKAKPKVDDTLKQVLTALGGIDSKIDGIDARLTKTEEEMDSIKRPDDEFKKEAIKQDVEKAQEHRKIEVFGNPPETIDPKINEIVDRLLGKDFGAKIETPEGRDGYTFTVTVPKRVSLLGKSSKPIADEDGKYKMKDNVPETEEYDIPDERSVALPTLTGSAAYEVIEKYCEKVRQNIVVTYNKKKQPIPAIGN